MEASSFRAPAGLRRLRGGPLLRLRSDDQLLAAFRAGNEDAFGVLHDRYRPRLHTYSRQMLGGSSTDAEDALQDVFLRAYHALRADDRPVSVRAWLYRVAHNRCIDQLRRAKPPTVELDDPSHPETAAAVVDHDRQDPARVAARREELQTLVTDVGRLPEQQRSALLLREMEGLSYAELAVSLECSVPAVKSLLVRARMGLVEQAEARALSCADIRSDLDQAHDRGVRMSGRARRHLRDCDACRTYRDTLKGVASELHGLAPAASLWAKLLGLGGAGSSAAAGGAAAGGAAAGGSIALVGSGAAATVSKVAAIFCCAAVVGGGAAEVQERFAPSEPAPKEERAASGGSASSAEPVVTSARPQATVTVVAPEKAGADAKAADDAKAERAERREREAAEERALREEQVTPLPGQLGLSPEIAAAQGAGSLLAPDEPTPVTPPAGDPSAPTTDATPAPGPSLKLPLLGDPAPAPAPKPTPTPAPAPAPSGTTSEVPPTPDGSIPAEGPGAVAAPAP